MTYQKKKLTKEEIAREKEQAKKIGEDLKKDKQRKPKYKAVTCFKWMMGLLWKDNKSIAFSAVAVIPLAIILYGFNLYLTPTIIGMFEQQKSFGFIALIIALLLVSQLVFRIIKDYIDSKRVLMNSLFGNLISVKLFAKKQDMEDYLLLDPEICKKERRAWNSSSGCGAELPGKIGNMAVNIICFFLFGSIIATLNPFIVVLLVGCAVANFFARKYKTRRDWRGSAKRDLNWRKMNYMTYDLARDLKPGKDIRLFAMQDYVEERTKDLIAENGANLTELQNTQTFVQIVASTINLLRDGLAYGYLLYNAVHGNMTAAEFTLYFGAISQLSNFFIGIVGEIDGLLASALQISDFREFLEIKGAFKRTGGVEPKRGVPVSVEFRNVSYKYPEGEETVLENISFKIESGEKIALVGVNGAGKTTLVRLMCGMLLPDEGEVLIDGKNVLEYNLFDLYDFFSVVPQEYNLLPSTITENVTVCDESERDTVRMNEAIKAAGLWEKVGSLEKGADTPLENRWNPDGVRLSGGETQKLLLARSIYRSSQIMILDEPTSALDPIAEDEMYRQYTKTAANCTSVFISHRLASTRFCDRIYLLDGKRLAECGTHEELMASGGTYRMMFDVQSEYYKEVESEKG